MEGQFGLPLVNPRGTDPKVANKQAARVRRLREGWRINRRRTEQYAERKISDPEWYKRQQQLKKARYQKKKAMKEEPVYKGYLFHIQRTYGLSSGKYHEMLQNQAGACAVCSKQSRRLVVDHNHKTGDVRGLVCDGYNTYLAAIENPEWVAQAKTYLHRATLEE